MEQDGGLTIVRYSTTGAAAAVALTGSVIPTATLTRADGTGTGVVSTTQYGGYSSGGPLAFQPPDRPRATRPRA